MGTFFRQHAALLLILVVPHLAARPRDELEQVQAALLQDVAEALLVPADHRVVVPHVTEQLLLGVIDQLVERLVVQPAPEPAVRAVVNPNCLHFCTL